MLVYHEKEMAKSDFKRLLISRIDLFVLIFCLLVTYGAWLVAVSKDTTDIDELRSQKARLESDMAIEIKDMFQHVTGVAGLYASSEQVDPKELAGFMEVTAGDDHDPSLMRIQFIKAVDKEKVGAFEKEMKSVGSGEYKAEVEPMFETQFYEERVVDHEGKLYPPSGRNWLNDRPLANLLEEVLREGAGEVAYLPQIKDMGGYNEQVMVMGVPVYRERKLLGIVSGVMSLTNIEKKIGKALGEKIAWVWTDSNGGALAQVGEIKGKVVQEVASLHVLGRSSWNFELKKAVAPSQPLNLILGLGVLISFILYAMVYGLTTANARGEEMAERMTEDLQKYRLALENASNHIIITDPEGKILYANKAVETLTGYSRSETLGSTPRLWGGQMPLDFYQKMWKTIKEEKKVFESEITNKRKNGELYIAQTTISPIIDDRSEGLMGFVGIEVDITKKKKDEEEVLKMNDLMVGRELKMVELKKEIESLKKLKNKAKA